MQSKKAIQIRCGILISRLRRWNCDRWPQIVIASFAEWNDDIQPIDRAALKDGDQDLLALARRVFRLKRTCQPGRRRSNPIHRECRIL